MSQLSGNFLNPEVAPDVNATRLPPLPDVSFPTAIRDTPAQPLTAQITGGVAAAGTAATLSELGAKVKAGLARYRAKGIEAIHQARATGEDLIAARAGCKRGEWLPWLAEWFDKSEDTAEDWMWLASNWADAERVLNDPAFILPFSDCIRNKPGKKPEVNPAALVKETRRRKRGGSPRRVATTTSTAGTGSLKAGDTIKGTAGVDKVVRPAGFTPVKEFAVEGKPTPEAAAPATKGASAFQAFFVQLEAAEDTLDELVAKKDEFNADAKATLVAALDRAVAKFQLARKALVFA